MNDKRFLSFSNHLSDPGVLTHEDLVDEVATHLLKPLKQHHRPTYDHCLRVADLSCRLATYLQLPSSRLPVVRRAAFLHDLGKVMVPVSILDKPTDLNDEEWACMDGHCEIGAEILAQTHLLDKEAYVVKNHHRWYAANNCLEVNYQEDLDSNVDLLGVSDAYDALISERPYSSPKTIDLAINRLETYAGEQFNPDMIKGLKQMLCEPTSSHFKNSA